MPRAYLNLFLRKGDACHRRGSRGFVRPWVALILILEDGKVLPTVQWLFSMQEVCRKRTTNLVRLRLPRVWANLS